MKNYGLNLEKERSEINDQDWIFGSASSPCFSFIAEKDRELYLPEGEVQRSDKGDMMDCTTRSPLNILEAKFSYLVSNGVYHDKDFHRENIDWLLDNGYVVTKEGVKFSDAFVAINSGTTPNGNSLKAPLEAIRKQGLVPKALLPLKPHMTWGEYHDPARITSEIRELGKEFARRFTINYDRVYEPVFEESLKEDFLNVAGYAWPKPVNGEYPNTEYPPNHAFVAFKNPKYYIFDNYIDSVDGDFIKKLASNYNLLDYAYRVFIKTDNDPSKIKRTWGWLIKIINFFKC